MIEQRLRRYFGRRAADDDIVAAYLFEPALRIAFEVRTRNVWFDLQPLLRTYRRSAATVR